ncbi:hypothetical protein BHE74_00010891 [Ensete ventricosum]|nr:hypothetical protein BHE74_00010891 [Ensete ventricosum]
MILTSSESSGGEVGLHSRKRHQGVPVQPPKPLPIVGLPPTAAKLTLAPRLRSPVEVEASKGPPHVSPMGSLTVGPHLVTITSLSPLSGSATEPSKEVASGQPASPLQSPSSSVVAVTPHVEPLIEEGPNPPLSLTREWRQLKTSLLPKGKAPPRVRWPSLLFIYRCLGGLELLLLSPSIAIALGHEALSPEPPLKLHCEGLAKDQRLWGEVGATTTYSRGSFSLVLMDLVYHYLPNVLADLYSCNEVLLSQANSTLRAQAGWLERERKEEEARATKLSSQLAQARVQASEVKLHLREIPIGRFKARYYELNVDEDPYTELPSDAEVPPIEVPFDDHSTSPLALPPPF